MGLMKWAESKTNKLGMKGIAILKTYCVLIGMVIGAYAAGFVKSYIWYFAALIIVLMIILFIKIFKK